MNTLKILLLDELADIYETADVLKETLNKEKADDWKLNQAARQGCNKSAQNGDVMNEFEACLKPLP
jgi:uncharacterized protein with von Willebrand factor type A (vWA) domain